MPKKTRLLCLFLCLLFLLSGCDSVLPSETEQSNLKKNLRKPEDFSEEDGIISYPGALLGIDVYGQEGEIDWELVKQSGVSFAILQLGYRGYTEGALHLDERYAENLAGAKQAGLQLGVYFYSQALSAEEAEEEADFVLQVLGGQPLDLPVFFDWEEVTTGRTAQKASPALTDYAAAFCKKITDGGYSAGVYFNQLYGYTLLELEELSDYMFWLAEYRDHPTFPYDAPLWQFTADGKIDGIKGRTDLNLYFTEAP